MAHLTGNSVYQSLLDRINSFPAGAPPSDLVEKILAILFSPDEAALVARLPIRSFRASKAAALWGMNVAKARDICSKLAGKGLLVDVERDGTSEYSLPPPMAGFFEFALMRVRPDIDQKALSELFYQYLNVEEDFIRELFSTETQLGRAYVNEEALSSSPSLQVLDFDRVSFLVQEASATAVGICYCRHKMSHVGRACTNRQDNCITLNSAARSLIKHGIAREISKSEALEIFRDARASRLVQFGENVREGVNFICNCCKCCCEGMIAARRFGWLHPVHATSFQPEEVSGMCRNCGKCLSSCPVDAISRAHPPDAPQPAQGRNLNIDLDVCLGCGVCVAHCPARALQLRPRKNRILTPVNTSHRVVLQAIEKGTLQNLIFDCQALASHRAMAAILGVILRLPPVKQIMASKQMKSVFLDWLLGTLPAFRAQRGSPHPVEPHATGGCSADGQNQNSVPRKQS